MTPISAQSIVAQLIPLPANEPVPQTKTKDPPLKEETMATTAALIKQVINYLIAEGKELLLPALLKQRR